MTDTFANTDFWNIVHFSIVETSKALFLYGTGVERIVFKEVINKKQASYKKMNNMHEEKKAIL